MGEFFKAFMLVFVAEFGDKSQILAMTYAAKYKGIHILIGTTIGFFFNHLLAVVIGYKLTSMFDLTYLQIVSGILFFVFGLLSLRREEQQCDNVDKKGYKIGIIVTVAVAFFICELGDKTQLSALTLALTCKNPVAILLGTTTAMAMVASLGIFVIKKLKIKISQNLMKIISAFLFVFYGFEKLYAHIEIFKTNQMLLASFIVITFLYLTYLTSKLIEE